MLVSLARLTVLSEFHQRIAQHAIRPRVAGVTLHKGARDLRRGGKIVAVRLDLGLQTAGRRSSLESAASIRSTRYEARFR